MMRALSASELLTVWERGVSQTPVERALTLLGAACADEPAEVLARLSVGERDSRLLLLREWTFGPELESLVHCPSCGEQLELVLFAADLRAKPAAKGGAVNDTKGAPPETLTMTEAGYEVSFRLPNSLDLAYVAQATSLALPSVETSPAGRSERTNGSTKTVSSAATTLLERCLIDVRYEGAEMLAASLPTEVIEAVSDRMAEADPQAEIELAVDCPSCGESWQAPFDIESFFWNEICAWARRILGEVHVIASRYGWREADILNMTAQRRQFYLDLIGA